MVNKEFCDRFIEIIRTLKLKQVEIAKICNVDKTRISDIKYYRSEPTIKIIRSLIKKYPHIDIEWLFTGNQREIKDFDTGTKNMTKSQLLERMEKDIEWLKKYNVEIRKNEKSTSKECLQQYVLLLETIKIIVKDHLEKIKEKIICVS